MLKRIILPIFLFLIIIPLALAQEDVNLSQINKSKDIGFAIYQFDLFRCYSDNTDRYHGSPSLELDGLNGNTSQYLLNNLINKFKEPKKLGDITIEQDKFYNNSFNFNYFFKNQYGDEVGFYTDGKWWLLSFIKNNVSLYNSSLLNDYYTRVSLQTMDAVKLFISRSMVDTIENAKSQKINYCEMESDNRDIYFSAFNFFVQNYFDKLDCVYSNDSIIADCDNSKVLALIPKNSVIFEREFKPKPLSYKVYNSFIILNTADIKKAQRDYDFDLLGKSVIISEYPVFGSLSSGHNSYLDMIEYIKNLKDTELKIKKIDYIDKEIIQKSENLTRILSEASNIANSDISVREKQSKLNKLERENYDFSIYIKKELSNLNIDLINKERFFKREKETFYGSFYESLTEDYISNLEISLNELKLNLDYYQDNIRYLQSYITQLNLNFQFQLESEKQTNENTQSLLVTSVLALFAVFSSIIIFLIDKILEKYGYRVFILYITSRVFIIIIILLLTLVILKLMLDFLNNTYFLINFSALLSFLTFYTIIYWHDSKFVRDQCVKQIRKSNGDKKEKQTAFEILMNLLISSYENKELETYNLYLKEVNKLFKNPPKQIRGYLDEFIAKIFSYYGAILPKDDIQNLLELLKKDKTIQTRRGLDTKLNREGLKPRMGDFMGYYG